MKLIRSWTATVLFVIMTAALGASGAAAQSHQSPYDAPARTLKSTIQQHVQRHTAGTSVAASSLLEKKTTFEWVEDDWMAAQQTSYEYNELGRLAAWTAFWDGSDWINESVVKTTPGGSGYTLSVTELYDPSTQLWTPVDQIQTDFLHEPGSGEPFINFTLYQTWSGDEWLDTARDSYTYSEAYEIERGQTDLWDGEAWVPETRFAVIPDGAHVAYVDQEWDGINWQTSTRTIYLNFTVKDLQRRMVQIGNELADYEDILYGIHLLPDTESHEWNGSEWVNVSRQSRTYDLFTGDVVDVAIETWSGDAWMPMMRFRHAYSSPGVVESISTDFYDGEAWSVFVVETYVRDDEGAIAETIQQFNGDEGLENAGRIVMEWNHLSSDSENDDLPHGFALDAAYPNPFNPATHLTYHVVAAGHVAIRVYDTLGRQVATLVNGMLTAGSHDVSFDGANLPSGQYIIRMEAEGFTQARVVTLLK